VNTPLCIFISQNSYLQILKTTEYQLIEYQLNNDVTIPSFCFVKKNPQLKHILELKSALVKIWDELPQDAICKSIANFRKRLRACVNADGGHFEQLL